MNIKEKILAMDKQFAKECLRDPVENIEDLSLSFIIKFQLFEPCQYVSEDDEWLTFLILPPEEILESQIMTLRKEEIISFGILNEKNLAEINNLIKQIEPESLYQ
ncbi:hypothetical protein [Methanobrevibacter sp.]|uniref:hypothetical protein n=1 Tax=Methanobrevibacter sp. TaxID=66852 RepID=UPI0026E02095|nr:hypothetical protein [Methanobrevibacter sp.]MDO5859890.1 hypothetical protein [Methanobrevibacter sp.]